MRGRRQAGILWGTIPVLKGLGAALIGLALMQVPTGTAMAATAAAVAEPLTEREAAVSELNITLGKSNLVNLTVPISRVSLGNPAVADVQILSPRQIYVLGKSIGSTNVMLWDKAKRVVAVVDVNVGREMGGVDSEIKRVAKTGNVRVRSVGDAVVLEGHVPDSRTSARVSDLAEALAGKKVVNMLTVDGVQQVMLEVKIAEIRRDLTDKLGIDLNWTINGGITSTILQNHAFTALLGGLTFANRAGNRSVTIDAEKKDELVKILAEPNIVAMSGQEGSFLAGGEILVPVTSTQGVTTLETKQFGVGLRFTPTVLEDGRISLRVLPEVTDVPTTVNNFTTLSTRRASTTVELRDGQSLAIGGLLQNNIQEAVRRLPILGEIPILGALFRSSDFVNKRTELLIVVTPRLIKPLPANYSLPTDAFKEPSRAEFFLEGRMEGRGKAEKSPGEGAEQPAAQPASSQDGHQLK